MNEKGISGKFVFCPPQAEPAQSLLYHEHLKLTAKSQIADFAGYLMPLWYSSISAEHQAVRQKAGIFDCTHMGVLEVTGPTATAFLNTVCTNDVNKLAIGSAQYSYILDAAGNVLDDIIIYARQKEKFMVVVNASNEPKIKAYLAALKNGQAVVDTADPKKQLPAFPQIRDMRDTKSGADCRADIALQGPASKDILLSMMTDAGAKTTLQNLKSFKLMETEVAGINCIITTTGYTGAKVSFELFAHPDKIVGLWQKLLQAGKSFGLIPCGLGARDSLRVEAGLPLYGHELDGPFNISPFEAGYGWAVKLEKDFFIGKTPIAKAAQSDMAVVRIELPGEKGVRPARHDDAIIDRGGKCVGWILSCAKAEEKQIALAYVKKDAIKENETAGVYYLARNQKQLEQGKLGSAKTGQVLSPDIVGRALTRFEKF